MRVILRKSVEFKNSYYGKNIRQENYELWRNGVKIKSFSSRDEAIEFCEALGFEIGGEQRTVKLEKVIATSLTNEQLLEGYPGFRVIEL